MLERIKKYTSHIISIALITLKSFSYKVSSLATHSIFCDFPLVCSSNICILVHTAATISWGSILASSWVRSRCNHPCFGFIGLSLDTTTKFVDQTASRELVNKRYTFQGVHMYYSVDAWWHPKANHMKEKGRKENNDWWHQQKGGKESYLCYSWYGVFGTSTAITQLRVTFSESIQKEVSFACATHDAKIDVQSHIDGADWSIESWFWLHNISLVKLEIKL